MSPYRIAQGSAAVSGAQAIPVPELAAAHLNPGESLTLRYGLQSTDVADFTATITLKTRKNPDCLSGIPLHEPVTTGLQTLAMCLPGFRLEEAAAAIMGNEVRLDPGYSVMLLAPQQDWLDDAGVESHQSGQHSTPLIRLPALAPGSIRVDRLLEALMTSGRASSLSVEIGRVSLGRRDIKLIERAREACRVALKSGIRKSTKSMGLLGTVQVSGVMRHAERAVSARKAK